MGHLTIKDKIFSPSSVCLEGFHCTRLKITRDKQRVKAYTRTYDESIWPFSVTKRQFFFLLQTEHDNGQREDQCLA